MEPYRRQYFARNRARAPFRPRVHNFGDRWFNRDYRYWQGQMGRPQRRFAAPRLDRVARARRAPWQNRQNFAAMYGADADYDDWQEARRYRADDLDDPRVFGNVVADRRVMFEGDEYGLEPADLMAFEESEAKRQIDEIDGAIEDDRALKKIKNDEA